MPYPIEKKLVVGVASSALFDLSESHRIFLEQGEEEYKKYQEKNIDTFLDRGVAFPFIRRFLNINKTFNEEMPVEVVLLSKNSLESGLRVFRSINHYKLDITRAAFTTGQSPYRYIPAFNISLFLSANKDDVNQAINAGFPGGLVMPSEIIDDHDDRQLRVAFDFDGVIADDESESIFKKNRDVGEFQAYEVENSHIPHKLGPLGDLFKKLSFMQKLENKETTDNPSYQQILRISIITARNAPAHERVVTTLKAWGVSADDTFLLGGMEKNRVINILKPHIFFDDQLTHLSSTENIPMVHVPFGIANKEKLEPLGIEVKPNQCLK
jgi:5'-nucleotidase